jgi:hypothetical protein
VERNQRSSILVGITTALVLTADCSSSSTPSSFGTGGGSEGGVMDAASMDTGSFGGGGGSGNFMCGAMMCTRYQWCLFIVSDAGAEMSATCIPYGACQACNCLTQMVSTAQCAGDTVTCTPQPPLTVSCLPAGGSMMPGDSGPGD